MTLVALAELLKVERSGTAFHSACCVASHREGGRFVNHVGIEEASKSGNDPSARRRLVRQARRDVLVSKSSEGQLEEQCMCMDHGESLPELMLLELGLGSLMMCWHCSMERNVLG